MRVRVEVLEFDPKPIGVYAKPLEYDALKAEIIPEEDRHNEKYDGCSLFISTKVLNESFELESA